MPTKEQIRKKKQRIKSGELKFNKAGLQKGTPKPRRGIKEAEKIYRENIGPVKKKTFPSQASFFGAADDEMDKEIKRLDKESKSTKRKRAPWTKMKGMGMVGGGGKK